MTVRPRVLIALVVVAGAGIAAAGYLLTRPKDAAETPSLFTNVNGGDVWENPGDHLGARVKIVGPVEARRSVPDGVIVAMRVNGQDVGAYVFDPSFEVRIGRPIEVTGDVRGPLGGELTLGIEPFDPLEPGAAMIDAVSARNLARG